MKTKVIFRYWQREIIALFPEVPSDVHGYYCESYEHVGQHGGADCQGVVAMSTPAKPEEYESLRHELVRIGYVLHIIKRCPSHAYHTRRAEIKATRSNS